MKEMHRVCRPGSFIILSAMHPALFLRNTQAGFPDPQTGVKIQPQSYAYSIADLFSAGQEAGLVLDTLNEKSVTDELVAASPKAAKYHGWPMLLLMRWKRN
jgi:malonyl-CoA O-methyltransferase